MTRTGIGRSRLGHFSEDGREYICTRIDTPRPWLNYLTNDQYGTCISQTGLGYSFYRAAFAASVTYHHLFGYVPVNPQTGKFVYLHDAKSGRSWPLAPMTDAEPYKAFCCRQGLGYTIITAQREGIEAELAVLVPRQDPGELWRIRLKNLGKASRTIRLFPYVEMTLNCTSGITDVLTYTRGRWEPKASALIYRMTNPTSPFMYDAFMAADYPVKGYDCRRSSFLGPCGTIYEPEVPAAGKCRNSIVSGEQMCAVLAGQVTLRPGQEKVVHVLVGVSHADADIRRYRKTYLVEGAWDREFNALGEYWSHAIQAETVHTPSKAFDLEMNVWTKYQNHLTSRWTRGLDKGYRDVLQDVMGYTPIEPAWTRQWLTRSLENMFASGLCPRQYSVIGGPDDLRLHRDSPLWVPLTLDQYLRETGDLAYLQEVVAFRDGGRGTIWEHVLRGLNRLYRERGQGGLCKIGDGDWNDSLNEVARKGRGVSAWLTIGTIYAMQIARLIAQTVGDSRSQVLLRARIAELDRAVNRSGWDGQWYLYALDDDGRKIGSHVNDQGRIHLNCQTWAIFAGVARGERLKKVLLTIDRQLMTRYGPLLIHPAYTQYRKGIGKVSGKNPGMAENGPIYAHGAAFKILADCVLGRGNQAFETYLRVSPHSPWNTPEHHGGEPFASHRYLIGPGCPERFGQAAYPWFCAWQAWMLMLGHQWIAGVRPEYDALRIDPCIPAGWSKMHVTRRWRGSTYDIRIHNPRKVQVGVREIQLDGEPLRTNRIPAPRQPGEQHEVVVVMGKDGMR